MSEGVVKGLENPEFGKHSERLLPINVAFTDPAEKSEVFDYTRKHQAGFLN
jgi:hypothetical protein